MVLFIYQWIYFHILFFYTVYSSWISEYAFIFQKNSCSHIVHTTFTWVGVTCWNASSHVITYYSRKTYDHMWNSFTIRVWAHTKANKRVLWCWFSRWQPNKSQSRVRGCQNIRIAINKKWEEFSVSKTALRNFRTDERKNWVLDISVAFRITLIIPITRSETRAPYVVFLKPLNKNLARGRQYRTLVLVFYVTKEHNLLLHFPPSHLLFLLPT